MASISNVKIGKKIGVVLGGTVLILSGLSALSLWGIRTNERLAAGGADLLTEARLAEAIAGADANVNSIAGKMVYDKKVGEDLLSQMLVMGKRRGEAVEEFKARANSPQAIQQGADMSNMAAAKTAASERVVALVRAGHYAEANELSRWKSGTKEKAQEASDWALQILAETETTRKATAATVWMAIVAGSLFAVAGAIFGSFVLTRGIAAPLTGVVAHLGRIADGDLSQDASPAAQARGDEIGILARAQQAMIVSLRKMVQEISGD
ncbi:MAG: HAMP domain-containing protein, partial [Bryobacteraceae bacterium]